MKNTILSIILAAGILLLVIPATSFSQDFPQWRGINRDGKVTGFNVPQTWPKELTQSWKVTVGFGDASPVLVGQKLYIFSRQEDYEILRCLDANTGKEIWKDSYTAGVVTGPPASHPGPRSTPTIAEGKVVTLGVNGILSCLDANSGKVFWRKKEFTQGLPQFFTGMSPIVEDGLCIAHLGGAEDGKIIGFDLSTGNIKWKWEGDGPSYSSPILITMDGKKQIIMQTDKNLMALALSDGKVQWQIPTLPERRFYNSASPMIDGQTIIYTGQGTGIRAIEVQKQGDGYKTVELWHNPDLNPSYNTPVIKEGALFGLTQAGKLFCINTQNGQTAWADTSMHKNFGAILDAGSVMIALPSSSELVVFKTDKSAYSEVVRYKVADTPVYAHPLLTGNRIYVKDNETLALWTVK
ncbi:MAG: PQQ-like beta-propeller repeat protein [Bacteroidales bacterium]|nr:PQQ-like beta-propeller repeat protein [Bacteroidales bacterium]